MSELREHFRPELLGRLDEIIHFRTLSNENLCAIVRLLLDDLYERAQAIELSLYADDEAIAQIVSESDSSASGARSLRRTLTRLVEDPLSLALLNGTLRAGDRVRILCENGALTLRPDRPLVKQ